MNYLKIHIRKISYLMVAFCFVLVGVFTKGGEENYGVWSMLCPVMLFAFAIMTKNVIEAFIWTGLLAAFMIERGGFFTGYMDGIQDIIIDKDNVYLIMFFLLIGIFIAFLKKSGAAMYFANFLGSKTDNPKILLLIDWILGIALSIDEYMAAFAIGASLVPLNDSRGIPREMSAYTIRSVNVNPSCLNPLNSWPIFIATILESIGFAAAGQGLREYLHIIPFLFFNYIAMAISLLAIMGVIPKLGGIKKAYKRVEAGGPICPENNNVDDLEEIVELKKGVNLLSFILPILALILAAFYFEFNMVNGFMAAVVIEVILYVSQRLIKVSDIVPIALEGIANMVELGVIFVISFTMTAFIEQTGFGVFVVTSISGFMTPWALPVVVFLVFSFTEYLICLSWALYLIAFLPVIQLAQIVGCNVYLAIAALVCAGAWGASASFTADNGLVVASACKINLYEQNVSQLAYLVISLALSAVAFLAAGVIMV